MTELLSTNPRTGASVPTGITPSTPDDVNAAAERAATAFNELRRWSRSERAALLRAMAEELESRTDAIVETADGETALGSPRLNGELTRTGFQLRLFAETLDEGSYLEASIDHAGDTAMGPRPDLRRMLLPLGPVAVFGASNFPLAFSVPGGDTASALAAGCPVVVKAHESHPLTSRLCGEALSAAATRVGAPDGTVQLVYGREAGAQLVQHPAIAAVGFTGSLNGGKALLALINQREDPIPFYGELSGLNPVVVTDAAARERAEEIGQGLAGSYTLGSGQFCTKPGLAFVPATPDGDRLVDALSGATTERPAHLMLNEGIRAMFDRGSEAMAGVDSVSELARGEAATGDAIAAQAVALSVPADQVDESLTAECFGPLIVVARYRDEKELLAALDRLEPSLTATAHLEENEAEERAGVLDALQRLSGRLVFNGFPTGVAVSWAQHHGGPWPSTNAVHTSVGPTAIRRFLRPYTWQNAPAAALPSELRDGASEVPRRVDGNLVLPDRG
ncbi:aldehyde dehydrogenase (NADP(+)) [Spiractinospora alimapuensis]|uniref:aldehyde dehydrogenase (NADP(+)) n=1 Tax=Spiractinospora alimapuensis TaxID=2820884 RepID=UPI001F27F44A|nr:aldehyde dehydrogenase (NADP(+)) [Spiractinospora alimapuensis]QVQ50258.1 aldehyde dehydrogenase (NADP(+)) [Spiractinospora alimapuensis]